MAKPSPTGPLQTRGSLGADLRALGVRPGETLLVHSSLSSLGWVSGGPVAVVQALLDALGAQGTLVVPAHSGDNSDPALWSNPPVPEAWWPRVRDSIPGYDPRTTRTSGVGVIPETVRTWPGALRSAHPQTSFAALGPGASHITEGHAVDCRLGEASPLARLEEVHARVLLLGAGFGSCTAFHLAEYRIPAPQVDVGRAVLTTAGRRWVSERETSVSDERFDELGAAYEKASSVVHGTVGAAGSLLFPLAEAVAYAQGWLAEHRPTGTGQRDRG